MGINTGSLLRLFRSEYFDAQLHMHYLLRMEQSGVQDYLVNELYKMPDDDVDFYIQQLCQVALTRYKTSSLHRFLLDKASKSMYFALRIHWLMQSFVEDRLPEISEHAMAMVNSCETAVVNSAQGSMGCCIGDTSPTPDVLAASGNGTPGSMKKSDSCPEFGTGEPSSSAKREPSTADEECSPSGGRATPSGSQQQRTSCFEFEKPLTRQRSSDSCGASLSPSATLTHGFVLKHLATLSQAHTPEQKAAIFRLAPNLPNAYLELGEPVAGWVASVVNEGTIQGEMRQFILKQRRCDYFNTQNHLVSLIVKLSTALVATPEKEERKAWLASTMNLINRWLFDRRIFMTLNNEGSFSLLGLHIPILRKRNTRHQILRIHIEQCRVFSSATRAPFLLVYETANLDEPCNAPARQDSEESNHQNGGRKKCDMLPVDVLESDAVLLPSDLTEQLCRCVAQELNSYGVSGASDCAVQQNVDGTATQNQSSRHDLRQRLAAVSPEAWLGLTATVPASQATETKAAPTAMPVAQPGPQDNSAVSKRIKRNELAKKTRHRVWGESWEDRKERIRQASPFGGYPSWGLNSVVVKGGDDLRQELLASQVIRVFAQIFREAGLPLWLYEAEVLVVNSTSGLMECFNDTMSVNGIKKHFPGKSLHEIFKLAFADCLFEAKQNFIESYAAYSLVVWFMQVKDRHNDNLLMVRTGHVVHLDFGFMLSNSPGGNIGFESAPFKLTQEFLDVMDGECSDQYEYFRTLIIRGFLEARKHVDRIVLPVRMLLAGSKLPCFREGADAVLQGMQDRFFSNLTEAACIEKIVDLIDTSVNNWRTIQYDNYQRIVNGIL